jgi:hypothetical protein
MAKKKPEPQLYAKTDKVHIRSNEIYCPLKGRWLKATPEERVRQEFIQHLHNH